VGKKRKKTGKAAKEENKTSVYKYWTQKLRLTGEVIQKILSNKTGVLRRKIL